MCRGLHEHNNEGPHKADGPQIYRGLGQVYPQGRHFDRPLLQLRQARHRVGTGRLGAFKAPRHKPRKGG